MSLPIPEWLARHAGKLRQSTDGREPVYVLFENKPQYMLVPVPVAGKCGCQVLQTVNGKRLDKGGVYPTPEAALQAGLEELRNALGW